VLEIYQVNGGILPPIHHIYMPSVKPASGVRQHILLSPLLDNSGGKYMGPDSGDQRLNCDPQDQRPADGSRICNSCISSHRSNPLCLQELRDSQQVTCGCPRRQASHCDSQRPVGPRHMPSSCITLQSTSRDWLTSE